MKKIFFVFCILMTLFPALLFAADGVITIKSKYKMLHTVDRFKTIAVKKGMKIIAQIKHSEAAKKVGVDFPATELIIFGNPKIGAPLMACTRSIALDLPQKMLIWEDRAGQAWLSFNDPVYIADRHKLKSHCRKSLKKITGALLKLSKAAGGIE